MYPHLERATVKPSVKNYTSTKPKPHSVKYADWKKDCASNEETPEALGKASENVG